MTLPTFLGIGVPKGGTSWLYALLATHPEVYIPANTKGLRYFNHRFDSGLDWYQSFFPVNNQDRTYKALGEITAHYLYCVECPERIAGELDQPKLILMLRNPVDRIWSHYKHTTRLKNYHEPFKQFLVDYPSAIRYSHYAEHIKRYQATFGSSQMLILPFDRVFGDIDLAREQIAEFLEIDPLAFPAEAGKSVVNKGFIPRYRTIYSLAAKVQWVTRDNQLHWPGHLAKKMGLKRLISVQGQKPESMSKASRHEMQLLFEQEISNLEIILNTDLSNWRT